MRIIYSSHTNSGRAEIARAIHFFTTPLTQDAFARADRLYKLFAQINKARI